MSLHPLKAETTARGARMLRTAFGPGIAAWLEDPAVVEVMLNPDGRLWIDRLAEGLADTGRCLSFSDGERIIRLVAHHVGAEVHADRPCVSAELPETGERFEGLLPPVVAAPTFAIRKPAVAVFTLEDYVAAGIMTAAQATALRTAVAARRNILVAGGTSTGKTTLTNALLAEVAREGAHAAGSNMPWEQPLQQVLESIEGPVAKIIAVIIIIVTGLTLAFGDTSGGFRRLVQIVFGISIAFPSATFPGILDELNALAFEYRWCTRALCLDRTDAQKLLTRIRRQWFAKRKSIAAILKEVMTNEQSVLLDNDAANKAADADEALQELGQDIAGWAYVTATVTVWDEDARAADDKLRLVEKVIQSRDFTVIREGVNAVEAWLGSLPGHLYANVRQPPISTLNLAHIVPISAVWAGPERNEHLGGPPLFHARTEGSTPFRFSLHVGDVGHTLVIGPTGAGKSVLLALMALQFRRYAGAQVFAFDFGGSIRAATIAMGGDWHDLGGALAGDMAEPVALQPLARIDAPEERAWAAEWIAGLLAREGVAIDPAVKDHLWSALSSLASAPIQERTLTGLAVLLQSQALKRALEPYTLAGPWGRLLDAEAERLGEAEVQAFETEGLIGTAAAPAVLAYLFHAIGRRLDGRPTLIIVDEGWLALDDATFGAQLREWLKTLRKKNASVVFATQSLADVDGSAIAPAIIESCPTRIFLPNERALEPQIAAIYARFGLNDRQTEILARATPKRDYYCQSRRGNRLFELGLSEVALAFCAASSKTDQAAIAETLAAHGCAGFARAWLLCRGLDWAAELLPDPPEDIAP